MTQRLALEGAFEMVERDQPVACIKHHADGIEAEHGRPRPVAARGQPLTGHPAHPDLFAAPDGVERHPATASVSRFDLTEGDRVPVKGDDVKLAPARPVVALEDRESAPSQVVYRQLLAGRAEVLARVGRHARRRYARASQAWVTAVPIPCQLAGQKTHNRHG
jgi:hypothetical protein